MPQAQRAVERGSADIQSTILSIAADTSRDLIVIRRGMLQS